MLSACVVVGPGPGGRPPVADRPTFAEGSWGDAGGVATATLSNGSFVSVANDTGNRVAEGNYRYVSQGNIEISYYSLLQQKQIRANCSNGGTGTLLCTNDSGQQFQLYRRA